MDDFLYDLELALEVLLTNVKPEKRFITVEGIHYSSAALINRIKVLAGKKLEKEKLVADFLDGWTIRLERMSPDTITGDQTSYFIITAPGLYSIDLERELPIDKFKKAWARISRSEQENFIAGLEAAKMPPDDFVEPF